VELALESARTVSPAITTELLELSGLKLDPYIAVGAKSSDRPDDFPALREKLEATNVFGILMGSPVYMGIVSSPLQQLFERMKSSTPPSSRSMRPVRKTRATWPRSGIAAATTANSHGPLTNSLPSCDESPISCRPASRSRSGSRAIRSEV